MDNVMKVKAKFGQQVRRFTLPSDLQWSQLCHQMESTFEIENVALRYIDEEDDEVSLGSEGEFLEALKVVKKTGLLKLIVDGLPIDSMDSKMDALFIQDSKVQSSKRKAEKEDLMDVINSENQSSEDSVEIPPEPAYIPLVSSSDSDTTSNTYILEPKKKRKKKYYAALAEEVGNINAEQISTEEKKTHGHFKDEPSEAPTMDKTRKCKLSKMEKKMRKSGIDFHLGKYMEKFVQQTVEGVLHGLDGAVIESHRGTSGKSARSADKEKGKNVIYYHAGIICDHCDLVIAGVRYKCGNCPNFDLCERCEALEGVHNPSHVFIKIRYPVSVGSKDGVMTPLLQEIIYKDCDINRLRWSTVQTNNYGKDIKQLKKELRREEKMQEKEEKRHEKEALKADKRRWKEHLAGKLDKDTRKQFIEERRKFKIEEYKKKRRVAAAGDCITFDPRLRAEFVADHSVPDGMALKVNSKFVKHWLMKNKGTIAWNEKTKLICKYGTIPVQNGYDVQVPCLSPGEQGIFSVEFISPSKPGLHHSVWKLSHDGTPFGPDVWCNIKVVEDADSGDEKCESIEKTHDKVSLTNSAIIQTQSPLLVSPQSPSQELMAFELLNITDDTPQADGQLIKSVESESLTTIELEWDSANFTTDLNTNTVNDVGVERQESGSSVEIVQNNTASEHTEHSDDEDDYCIVPLPACFDPDIPLTEEDIMVASKQRNTLANSRSSSVSTESERSTPSLFCPDIPQTNTQSEALIDPNVDESNCDIASTSDNQNNEHTDDSDSDSESEYETDDGTCPASVHDDPPVGTLIGTSEIVTSQPSVDIVTQAEPLPVSTQPETPRPAAEAETESPVLTQPGTSFISSVSQNTVVSSRVHTDPNVPTDFASTVVSGALATAIDAVASAGQAVGATLQNLIGVASVTGPRGPENGTATYIAENNEVQLNQTSSTEMAMRQLFEMGFCDRKMNSQVLAKHNNDVHQAITELLEMHNDDWHQLRH